jgi:hypothetical protein
MSHYNSRKSSSSSNKPNTRTFTNYSSSSSNFASSSHSQPYLSSSSSNFASSSHPQHKKSNNTPHRNFMDYDYDGNMEEEKNYHQAKTKVIYSVPTPTEYNNLIINKDPNKFQYCFGTECTSGFFGTLACDLSKTNIHLMDSKITWEEARFLIEKKHGLFNINQQRKSVTGAYIEGFFWTTGLVNWRKEAQPVPRDHVMNDHDQIIVIRKPAEKGVPHYIPTRFKLEVQTMERQAISTENKEKEEKIVQHLNSIKPMAPQFTDTMTEDEKINLLINSTAEMVHHDHLQHQLLRPNQYHHNSAQYHPSDVKNNPSIVKPPPPYYTCHRCHQKGHWKQHCTVDENFIPIAQHKLPKGIPKTMLKEVQNDEEKKNAMRTSDGKYVLRAESTYKLPTVSGINFSVDDPHVDDDEDVEYY